MSEQVRIQRGVAVEMRDGVHLATDVYLPDGPGPFPTLVTASAAPAHRASSPASCS